MPEPELKEDHLKIASRIPILLEVHQGGPVAGALIERLRVPFTIRGPDRLAVLEVLVEAENWEEAARRVAAVLAGVSLDWQAYLRLLR